MGNYLWVKTKHRQELLDEVANIPEIGKWDTSKILEAALEEFIKKHGKSKNPQCDLDMFHKDGILAIPNLYEVIDNPEMFKKFYGNIVNLEEFKLVDTAINELFRIHSLEWKRKWSHI